MSLASNLQDFATRVATEFKAIRVVTGALSALTTADKTSLVNAINEVKAQAGAASGGGTGSSINDTTPSTTTVYSSTKTNSAIQAAVSGLVNSSPAALDTLAELATALGNDANYAATTTAALGNRVRFDAAQTLTGAQQVQARANIAAGTSNLVIGTTAGTAADGAATATSLNGRALVSHTHAGADVAQATDALRGTIELATNTEVIAGTDAVRAVTPAGLIAAMGDPATNFVTTFNAGLV